MTDQTAPRRPRRGTAAIIGVLVLVIAAVVVIAVLTAGRAATPAATPSASGDPASSAPAPVTSEPVASTFPSPTQKPKPKPSSRPTPAVTASTPQPTKTATISSPAPIVKALTAEVTKMEAVQGKATGPGEIAGPSVRFTITITNSTGKKVDLSSTVVNAYAGADSAPAIPLQGPGGKSFPSSVAAGGSATGVFVFNIAKADRGHVEVTVDTSVRNPVVAFKGAAPR
jgi:cytoskeletal protein RodZ